MESLFLIFWEIAVLFTIATVPFHIPTNTTTYQFLQNLALIIFAFGIVLFFACLLSVVSILVGLRGIYLGLIP